jgi:hypothetical protein
MEGNPVMSAPSNPGDLVPSVTYTVIGIAGLALLGAAAAVSVAAWLGTRYRGRRDAETPDPQRISTHQQRVVKLFAVTGVVLLLTWALPDLTTPISLPAPMPWVH